MKKLTTAMLACLIFTTLQAQNTPHWHTVTSNTDKNLFCISFTDPQHGFVGGENHLLLKTTDSGQSWQALQPAGLDSVADIVDLQFVDSLRGYAVLGHFPTQTFVGKLFQTTDGGQTWQPANDTVNIAASRCYFFNWGNGFLIGSAFFAGNVVAKMQQGLWTEYAYFSYAPERFNYGIDFRDSLTGIVGGDGGFFYRTFNGGQTWDTAYSGKDSTIYAIKYLDDSTIIAATGHGNRSIIISRDSGATWTDEVNSFLFTFPVMKSLSLGAGDSIVAVGHSTNTGMNPAGEVYWFDGQGWQEQGFYHKLYDVAKQSAMAAFAVGDSGLIVTNKPQQPNAIEDKCKTLDEIIIFPNPAESSIRLQYSNLHIQGLQLTDLSGRMVKTFPEESKTLDVSGMAAGMYFLHIKAEDGEMAEKVEIR